MSGKVTAMPVQSNVLATQTALPVGNFHPHFLLPYTTVLIVCNHTAASHSGKPAANKVVLMPKHKQTAEDDHPLADPPRDNDGRRALFDGVRHGSPDRGGSKRTTSERDGKRRRVEKTPPPVRRDHSHRRGHHDDEDHQLEREGAGASSEPVHDTSVDMLLPSDHLEKAPSLFDVVSSETHQPSAEAHGSDPLSRPLADAPHVVSFADVPPLSPLNWGLPSAADVPVVTPSQSAQPAVNVLPVAANQSSQPAVNVLPVAANQASQPAADTPRVLFPSPLLLNRSSSDHPRQLDEIRARLDAATRALDDEQRRIDQRRSIISGYAGLLDDIGRAGTMVPITVGTNPVSIGIDAAVCRLCLFLSVNPSSSFTFSLGGRAVRAFYDLLVARDDIPPRCGIV